MPWKNYDRYRSHSTDAEMTEMSKRYSATTYNKYVSYDIVCTIIHLSFLKHLPYIHWPINRMAKGCINVTLHLISWSI